MDVVHDFGLKLRQRVEAVNQGKDEDIGKVKTVNSSTPSTSHPDGASNDDHKQRVQLTSCSLYWAGCCWI